MRALILSPEAWDGHFVSKHHYAIELAGRGHEVVFHGPPETGPMRFEQVSSHGVALKVLRAPQVAPALRFLPGLVRRWLEARWLMQVERLLGGRLDVVWLFENSRFYDMRFADDRVKIYHQVDLNQNFHPEVAALTADHVFCTSRSIRDRLAKVCNRVTIIHHGVRPSAFDPTTEAQLFSKDHINCAYVGNLSIECLDRELILRCVEALPNIFFHFFGGFENEDPFQQILQAYPNTQVHGRVASHRILPILSNADVLMVVYEKDYFANQATNPHKMMEYMMSGKVIAATWTSEYESVSHLLAMAKPQDDYAALLKHVIDNLDAYNSEESQAARRAFAEGNTYSRQLDRIAAKASLFS